MAVDPKGRTPVTPRSLVGTGNHSSIAEKDQCNSNGVFFPKALQGCQSAPQTRFVERCARASGTLG